MCVHVWLRVEFVGVCVCALDSFGNRGVLRYVGCCFTYTPLLCHLVGGMCLGMFS
jgi:hypothetical protein